MAENENKTTEELSAGLQQGVVSWAKMEMQTRDMDATHYESFFTAFQTAVELRAYAQCFAGHKSQRALEVGCGTGRTMGALQSRSIIGIDLSREELRMARARWGECVALVQASATHLPFRDGAFDQLLCAGVIMHIPGEERRALAIQEVARVLARPGRLVLSVYSYSWLARQRYPHETVRHDLYWYRFGVSELEALLCRWLSPCHIITWGICHLPRWRVGNRLGAFGVWVDAVLSRIPGLKHFSGIILVARVDLARVQGQ